MSLKFKDRITYEGKSGTVGGIFKDIFLLFFVADAENDQLYSFKNIIQYYPNLADTCWLFLKEHIDFDYLNEKSVDFLNAHRFAVIAPDQARSISSPVTRPDLRDIKDLDKCSKEELISTKNRFEEYITKSLAKSNNNTLIARFKARVIDIQKRIDAISELEKAEAIYNSNHSDISDEYYIPGFPYI